MPLHLMAHMTKTKQLELLIRAAAFYLCNTYALAPLRC